MNADHRDRAGDARAGHAYGHTPFRIPLPVQTIVDTLSARSEVVAIALGGSQATKNADAASDVDISVFVTADIPLDVRRNLATRFDPAPEIDNRWFGPTDEWADAASGTAIDLMYWERGWFEEQLRAVIEDHRPALGYTTALWFTMRHATSLFDRDGWLAGMQDDATRPYPDELARAIVAFNHPLLRTARSSWRHQIDLAITRDDPVSIQHRATELLASVFDIVFASTRALHPGEKRLLMHVEALEGVPAHLPHRIRALLHAASGADRAAVLPAVDDLCDAIDELVHASGL